MSKQRLQFLHKKGVFNYETLTVDFGGVMSKPEFAFTAKAIHVPPYKYTVREREDAGGGWYGAMETVTKTADRVYLIVKGETCIGVMYHPYHFGIKTNLLPVEDNTPEKKFLDTLNLKYFYYVNNKTFIP